MSPRVLANFAFETRKPILRTRASPPGDLVILFLYQLRVGNAEKKLKDILSEHRLRVGTLSAGKNTRPSWSAMKRPTKYLKLFISLSRATLMTVGKTLPTDTWFNTPAGIPRYC